MKTYTKRHGRRNTHNKRSRINIRLILAISILLAVVILGIYTFKLLNSISTQGSAKNNAAAFSTCGNSTSDLNLNGYPTELIELLSRNEETLDFIKAYPDRASLSSRPIDLSEDLKTDTVPLFLQWDKRWGYNLYGEDYIAIAGCGPTCLSMAYIYLKGDISMNPRKMAEWVNDMGYCSLAGTKWSLWTEGVKKLGLSGYELSLSENIMKRQLDEGGLIICSMLPGDFTTTGHIILIRGYDENGFYVNDPNSIKRSSKQWSYDTLSSQIKGMWGISPL